MIEAPLAPTVEGIDLGEVATCTCLRLRRTTRRVTQLYDRALAPTGLSVGQFGLLAHLSGVFARSGSGLSVGALAERLDMDPTTLNRTLRPLEAKNLVESRLRDQDRRVRVIAITDLGALRLVEAVGAWRKAQAAFRDHLGGDATLALNDLLDASVAAPLGRGRRLADPPVEA